VCLVELLSGSIVKPQSRQTLCEELRMQRHALKLVLRRLDGLPTVRGARLGKFRRRRCDGLLGSGEKGAR
jgi:hypothetical protein